MPSADARCFSPSTRSPMPRASAIASCCSAADESAAKARCRSSRRWQIAMARIWKRCFLLLRKAPSRKAPFRWLLEKEWRELLASRSGWLVLLGIGPLVGVTFISAVHSYAEVSGLNGTAAGVGEALSPLIGVWAPTFSACELAAVFLLPFVAIRLVAGDRQSGALKLEL